VHASDDPVAGAENSVVVIPGLEARERASELHVYAQGGHGFGVARAPVHLDGSLCRLLRIQECSDGVQAK
jgi:hypothetical protein